jgi:hypothetical protein
MTTKTGPRYVIFFLCVFLYTNYTFRFYLFYFEKTRVRVDNDDDENGPQMRHLGPRYVIIFLCFSYILHESFFIGFIYVLKGRGGIEWVVTTETGPNDASQLVWAISMFFFFLLCFLHTN